MSSVAIFSVEKETLLSQLGNYSRLSNSPKVAGSSPRLLWLHVKVLVVLTPVLDVQTILQ